MLTEDFGSLDWSVRRNKRCFIKLVFFLFSFCVQFDVRYGLLMHYSRETTGKKNLHQRIIRRTILNNLIKNKLVNIENLLNLKIIKNKFLKMQIIVTIIVNYKLQIWLTSHKHQGHIKTIINHLNMRYIKIKWKIM